MVERSYANDTTGHPVSVADVSYYQATGGWGVGNSAQ